MNQIGNVAEINEVKHELDNLVNAGLVSKWELPYENLLTRVTAAVFFIEPVKEENLDDIRKILERFPRFKYRENTERKLSKLQWRVEFNKDFEI
jgi:hypothetical protein